MKNLRKLVIASFMLVIAFVAVVSSTYAWFTTSSEATVNDITIGVVDADKSILISSDDTNWGKTVDIDFAGKFTPVTMITANGLFASFQELTTTNDLKPYLKDATKLDEITGYEVPETAPQEGAGGYDEYQAYLLSEAKKGYVEFDLYFQMTAKDAASMSNAAIAMELSKLTATYKDNQNQSNARALSSFRMAIATVTMNGQSEEVTIRQVIEGPGDGRYGIGDQFDATNRWMSIYAESWTDSAEGANPATGGGYVTPDTQNAGKYKLEADYEDSFEKAAIKQNDATQLRHDVVDSVDHYYEYVIENFKQSDYETALANDAVEGYAHIRIFVWMEGWDGDNVNAASGCEYTFELKFYAKDKNLVTVQNNG